MPELGTARPSRSGRRSVLRFVRTASVLGAWCIVWLTACAPATTDEDVPPPPPLPSQVVSVDDAVCRLTVDGASTADRDVVTLSCGPDTLQWRVVGAGPDGSTAEPTYAAVDGDREWRLVSASIDGVTCTRADAPVRLGPVTLAWTCSPRSGFETDPTWDGQRFTATLVTFSITASGFQPSAREERRPERVTFAEIRTPD